MRSAATVLAALTLTLVACASPDDDGAEPADAAETPVEIDVDDIDWALYVETTVDILEHRWLWTDTVDWDDLRDRYLPDGPDVTQSQAYRALELLTQALGDPGHTNFMNPMVTERLWAAPHEADEPPPPSGELIERVGYLELPGANVFTEETYRTYATRSHEIIAELDAEGVCGWVVDLRDNTGGHPGPMLTAVGALIGEGALFSFQGPQADVDWIYQAGGIHYESADGERGDGLVEPDGDYPYLVEMPDDIGVLLDDWQLDADHYEAADLDVPIAVLTGATTGSAGETTLIALMDRDRVRSFGQPTDGVPTRVGAAYLADGSVVRFADAAATSVSGRSFDGPITPDVEVDDATDALDEALSWISETEGC